MSHDHHVFRNPPPVEVRAALAIGDVPGALDAMVGSVLHGHRDWVELQDSSSPTTQNNKKSAYRLSLTRTHMG